MDAQEHNEVMAAAFRSLAASKIPRRFAGGFETWLSDSRRAKEIKEQAQAWVNLWSPLRANGLGLYLGGKVGVGKTHIGCAILKAVIERGFPACNYLNIADFFLEYRSTWNFNNPDSAKDLVDEVLDNDLLFVDDLGVEAGKPHEVEALYSIFDATYRHYRPTIIVATNYSTGDLQERFGPGNGERIMSRIGDITEPLGTFPVDDRRKRGGK